MNRAYDLFLDTVSGVGAGGLGGTPIGTTECGVGCTNSSACKPSGFGLLALKPGRKTGR